MAFDIEGARKEGYGDKEIADFLASKSGFDISGARKEGYGDTEIVTFLSKGVAMPKADTSGVLGKLKSLTSGIDATSYLQNLGAAEAEMNPPSSALPAVLATGAGLISQPVAGLAGLISMALPGEGKLSRANKIVEDVSSFVPKMLLPTEQDEKTAQAIGEILGYIPKKAGEGLGLIADEYGKLVKDTMAKERLVAAANGKPWSPEQTASNESAVDFLRPLAETIGEASAIFAIPGLAKLPGKIKAAVTDSTWFRKMTVPERGLVVQSLDDMVARGYSEGEILRNWNNPQWRSEALSRRAQGEAPEGAGSGATVPAAEPITTEARLSNPIIADALLKAAKKKGLPGPEGMDMGIKQDFTLTPSRGLADMIVEASRARLEGGNTRLLEDQRPASSSYSPELADLLKMVNEKKSLPIPEGMGEGFTVRSAEEELKSILRKGEQPWTEGRAPENVQVEYKPRLMKSGEPFKTELTARAAINRLGLADNFVVVPVEGGYGLKRVGSAASVKTEGPLEPDTEIRKIVINDMIGGLKAGDAGLKLDDSEGLVDVIGRYTSNPDWYGEFQKDFQAKTGQGVGKEEIVNVLGKVAAGKTFTGKQDTIRRFLEPTISSLERNDYYQRHRESLEKVASEPAQKSFNMSAGELSPKGTKAVIKGEVFTSKGYDKEGNVILKDGTTIKVDPFEQLDVEKIVKVPGGTTLYSGLDPIAAAKAFRSLASDINKAMPRLEALGRSVFESGKRTAKEWLSEMKRHLGDLWGKFKDKLQGVWKNLQAMDKKRGPAGSERGSLKKVDETGKDAFVISKKGTGNIPAKENPTPEAGQLFPESNRLSKIDRKGSVFEAIVRENPGVNYDGEITVYRATVGDSIRPNDYVAINKEVSKDHLQNLKDRGETGKIIEMQVKADDLLMANDATEFVYSPKNITPKTNPEPGGGPFPVEEIRTSDIVWHHKLTHKPSDKAISEYKEMRGAASEDPIIITEDNYVIDGAGRYSNRKFEGREKIEVIRLPIDEGQIEDFANEYFVNKSTIRQELAKVVYEESGFKERANNIAEENGDYFTDERAREILGLPNQSRPPEVGGRKGPIGSERGSLGDMGKDTVHAVSDVLSEAKKTVDEYLGAISTRLGNIDPSLKNTLRKFEYQRGKKAAERTAVVMPFIKKVSKMSKEDRAVFDLARKNGDPKTLKAIVVKYGLGKEYHELRNVLAEMHTQAVETGYDIGYQSNYHPRVLKDSKGFLDYFYKQDDWPVIQKAISAKETELQRYLSADEKAKLINAMLRGYSVGNISLSRPGQMKGREVAKVTPEINKFYMDSDAALLRYISDVTDAIEAARLFGRGKKGSKLGSMDNTIGAYTLDLLGKGKIQPHQEQELRSILSARFNEIGTRGLFSLYKNASYIDTMGSPTSAITQIGDLAWAFYRNGLGKSTAAAYRALMGRSPIRKEDVGIEKIASEFADTGLMARAVDKTFRMIGLEKMDNIGKETLINSTWKKVKEQAQTDKGREALRKELTPIFEGETAQLIKDIQSGNITENVRLYLFNVLSDFQPVSLSEMPEKYLTGGNGRIFYMLKTFTLKQFDVYRREIFQKIAKPGTRIEGLKNLIWLSACFAAANAGADVIKDLLLNRPIDAEDKVIDNLLRLFGISKFTTWKAREEGVGSAMVRQIAPPFKAADALTKDINKAGDGKGTEIAQSIPVFGKLYYWWLGKGAAKSEKKRERENKLEDLKGLKGLD